MTSTLDPCSLPAHADYLLAFARRRLSDPEVARDAVQDTFVAALAAPQSYNGRATPRTWLTGILKHKIVDAMRDAHRRAARFEDTGDALESIALPASEQPESRLERARFVAMAERQLERLPERSAQAFVSTELAGENAANVASALGISHRQLAVICFRARRKLRAALRPALAA
jgi:RNA polymerase sigma-70 factor (ECF subfamily)